MAPTWKLTPATFTPAEAADLTGVPAGTQRQWWNRGLLGDRSEGRARVTVKDLLGIMILAQCQPSRVGLKAVSLALPALTGSAVFKLALDSNPWKFDGSASDEGEFRNWLDNADDLGSDHILKMLGLRLKDLSRYLAVSAETTQQFDDIQVLGEVEHEQIVILLDSWGFAKRLKRVTDNDLFAVSRRTPSKE